MCVAALSVAQVDAQSTHVCQLVAYKLLSEMHATLRNLYEYNQSRGCKLVLAAAGSGASTIGTLFSVAGSSSLLLEAHVPYAKEAFDDYLQHNGKLEPPRRYASVEAAVKLAAASYCRAQTLIANRATNIQDMYGQHPVGIGVSGALHTSRERKGIRFSKTAGTRAEQEKASHDMVLDCIRKIVSGDAVAPDVAHTAEDDACWPAVEWHEWPALADTEEGGAVMPEAMSCFTCLSRPDPLDCLLDASKQLPHLPPVQSILYLPSTTAHPSQIEPNAQLPTGSCILSGSFNPFHMGHELLGEAAAQLNATKSGRTPQSVFELSAINADKPPLAREEVERRLAQFLSPEDSALASVGGASKKRWPAIVTSRPRFFEKARLFPGCSFVVGYDTAKRLIDPKYYDASEAAMMAALYPLHLQQTRFVVAGRLDAATNEFYSLGRLQSTTMPSLLSDMFVELPADKYRMDISSTELRAKAAIS